MKKRVIALLLAAVMLVGTPPALTLAEDAPDQTEATEVRETTVPETIQTEPTEETTESTVPETTQETKPGESTESTETTEETEETEGTEATEETEETEATEETMDSFWLMSLFSLEEPTLSGSGTAEDPWQINSAEDYQLVYDQVARGHSYEGEYLKQTADITLPGGWNPIGVLIDPAKSSIEAGANLYPFSGTLDGGGHTLTVPSGGLPLLGYVLGATVKNLNLYGEKIAGYGLVNNLEGVGLKGELVRIEGVTLKSGTKTLKSGLIGTYITTNDMAGCSLECYVTIKNCTAESGVVIGYDKNQSMIGSFAGRVNGTIENCVSHAAVYGKNYVGGILGTRDNALGTSTVSNCAFDGTVTASGSHAGGIAGGGYENSTAPNGGKVNITGCSASGAITGGDKVGGIVGGDSFVAQVWSNVAHTLKDNSFTGTVRATSGSYVGGIAGFYDSLNRYDDITGNYYASNCGAAKGIGFVRYIDTNCASHETASGATYFSTEGGTSGCPKVTGCHWKKNHNRSDDPLGADAAKLCYTDAQTTPVATELKVSGSYKTIYTKGEPLDLSGLVLTLVYSDKSTQSVPLSDVTVSGYQSGTLGTQKVTLSYQGLSAEIMVTVNSEPDDTITVTVSVLGDSAHGDNGKVHTLAGGGLTTWVKPTSYTLANGSTAWDVLKKAFADNGITCDASDSNAYGSVYIESLTYRGVTLKEFGNGPNSGWMYTVNGTHPEVGVSAKTLKNGDKVVFHYTDDYTKEEGSAAYNSTSQSVAVTTAVQSQVDSAYEDIYRATGDFLESLGTPSVGSIGGEWMVIGLKRSGREIPGEEGYYESVVQYIRENIDEQERLHFAKSSENSRMILALTALGRDVTNVGGHNLLMGLNDMEYVQKQGINGPIWALIALDSGNYPVPEGNATRDGLIQVILDAQLADGGWAISGDTGDSDMTGMALQSLAPYRNTREDVGAAVDRAIQLLSEKQNDDGSYSTFSGGGKMVPTSESTAQVIVALSALSIDAGEDSRFVKNGNSAVDALCAYYVDGGGFRHLSDGQRDGMATEQGYYALTAYFRFLQGQTPLYDMTDVIDRGGEIPEETKPVQPISQPKAAEPSLGYSLGTVAVSFLAGAVFAVVLFGGGIAVGFYFAKGRVRKNKE